MNWDHDRLQSFLDCESSDAVLTKIATEVKLLGFDYWSWGVRIPSGASNAKVDVHANYRADWLEYYVQSGLAKNDPSVRHGMRSVLGVRYSDIRHSDEAFFDQAASFGIVHGAAQSVWDQTRTASLLSCSRDTEQISDEEWSVIRQKLSWLAQVGHTAMLNLIMPGELPYLGAELTEKEKDALKRAADGMTSAEIAAQLDLHPRAIDKRLDSATHKLGARNRLQAVYRAVSLGLTDL